MTKVRIIRDWEQPDWMRQTPNGSGIWEDILFTEDRITDYDYLVCLNPPPYQVKGTCAKGNKWMLTQEPPVPEYRWHQKHFKYFDKVFTQHEMDNPPAEIIPMSCGLPWHIGRNYDELKSLEPGKKTDRLSTVTSNAYSRPGHKARFDLIRFLREENFDLELFGRGIRFVEDKFDAIYPYKYSIAIENSFIPHYWTEKIMDCFLSWSMPVYAGPPNIPDYFPRESMILIDPLNRKESKEIIEEAIANDLWSKNLEAIEHARNLVLEQYQFFPLVSKLIHQHAASGSRESFSIPKTYRPKTPFLTKLQKKLRIK